LNGIAYSCEGKKDYNSAAKYFEIIISGPDDEIKDEALFNLGRLYALIGNKDKETKIKALRLLIKLFLTIKIPAI